MKAYGGPPATLGSTAAAHMRLIVWCKDCRHQAAPDPAEMAARYGAETTVPEWSKRLRCSECGSRNVNMIAQFAGRLLRPNARIAGMRGSSRLYPFRSDNAQSALLN